MTPISQTINTHAGSTVAQAYPLVGVVTPVRNRKHWSVMLAEQLASQDYPLFKIFIVDSASTDGTPEALRALPIPGLAVLEASSAAYWTEATNLGVRRALDEGCEYVLTLNDDVVFPTNLVSSLVAAARKANKRLVGSVICYANEPGRIWGIGAYNNWKNGAFLQTGYANLWEDVLKWDATNSKDNLVKVEALCGNGTLIHKSVFDELGLYNRKNTPHYHADAEFTMRAARASVASWVALNARLYNRFTEEGDGPFAPKNLRFFSVRSANYIRPVLHVLQEYCPAEERVIALSRYLGKYLPVFTLRQRSKLLRIMRFLCPSSQLNDGLLTYFLPPIDPAMTIVEDFDILRRLPPREFVIGAYMYLLRRACSDMELNNYVSGVSNGMPRNEVLLEVIGSEEYRNLPQAQSSAFMNAAASAFQSQNLAETMTDSEFAVLAFASAKKRLPTRQEFAFGRTLLDLTGRSALLSAFNPEADPSASPFDGADIGEVEWHAPEILRADSSGRITIYLNVDVLCMALADARARTGVYRYVSAITRELARDSEVDLQVFYPPHFEQQWVARARTDPAFGLLKVSATRVSADGVVFYPYFPLEGPDARYKGLPMFVTLHDLFPLTNPEWFTAEAAQRFRRQTRILVDADHIFCNSEATRRQLTQVFPNMKASVSVAHFGFDPPPSMNSDALPKKSLPRGRYFLCVGTLEPRKNLENVLRAFSMLQQHRELEDMRMLVVGQAGWNVDESRLSELAGPHSSKIRFMGNLADAELWQLYREAVCTVFPSLAEGFGLPILESFACGVPVVTSNHSSMAEISDGGAILVNPREPSEIAAAIRRIATEPELRSSLSLAASSQAARFSWQRCATAHIAEFERVAREPNSRLFGSTP